MPIKNKKEPWGQTVASATFLPLSKGNPTHSCQGSGTASHMVRVAAETGLRAGELCGLTVDDIDRTWALDPVHGQLLGQSWLIRR